MAVVSKGLMIWGLKCHQNNSPVVCDGYVEYEEAEVDRLIAILKTILKITAAAAAAEATAAPDRVDIQSMKVEQ